MRVPTIVIADALCVGAVACSSSSSGGAAPSTVSTATAHVTTKVAEAFTLLPCPAHPTSTVEIEGCAEHQIVALDRRINARFTAISAAAADESVRQHLAEAQADWIAYRKAACTAESDKYVGGTLAPVAFANCEVRINHARLADLHALQGP